MMRPLWLIAGGLALALGTVGIFLPLSADGSVPAACRLLLRPRVGAIAPLAAVASGFRAAN